MSNGKEQMGTEELEPVAFNCYRVRPEEEGALEEGVNTYSVTVLMPDGEVRHQVVWARSPEDIGSAIRVLPGTRVIMTQMANQFVWDSEPTEEAEEVPELAPTP